VFGSLGRGNWDQFSDIDLDVVIADQVRLDPVEELTQLCLTFNPLGEHCAVIIPDDTDAGDVVFESLLQLSARYHPLATISPNIVDSRVLTGRIDHSAYRGRAQRTGDRAITGARLRQVCGCRRYRLAAAAMGPR
jgi:hypothetical protein